MNDIKPPQKTLDAWSELAEVMEKHGFYFDMFKPYAGKGKRIALNLPKGALYLCSANKRFTAETLKNHLKMIDKTDFDKPLGEWYR